MAEWEPLTITERRATEGTPGHFPDTHWTLSATPPGGWTACFDMHGGSKSGSLTYQYSEPEVHGNAIVWAVPLGDLADADRHIRERVAMANTRYRERLAEQKTRVERAKAEEAEKTARVDEYQAVLDKLNVEG